MQDNLKRRTLVFLILTMILTGLIGAALPQLQLKPGIPLPFQQDSQGTLQTGQPSQVTLSGGTSLKAVLGFILVLVVSYIGYKMVKGVPWRQVLVPALFIALLALVALTMLFLLLNIHTSFEPLATDILPPAVNLQGPALGPLPPGLVWLVWGAFAAGIVLLAVWLIRWRAQSSRGNSFESEAQQALQALQSGSDLYEVIQRCYIQMSQALQKEHGIERGQAMTAREFERLLEAGGFPSSPVHQLTLLFENARYGHRRPAPGDEQKAIDCLEVIVQYSRATRASN